MHLRDMSAYRFVAALATVGLLLGSLSVRASPSASPIDIPFLRVGSSKPVAAAPTCPSLPPEAAKGKIHGVFPLPLDGMQLSKMLQVYADYDYRCDNKPSGKADAPDRSGSVRRYLTKPGRVADLSSLLRRQELLTDDVLHHPVRPVTMGIEHIGQFYHRLARGPSKGSATAASAAGIAAAAGAAAAAAGQPLETFTFSSGVGARRQHKALTLLPLGWHAAPRQPQRDMEWAFFVGGPTDTVQQWASEIALATAASPAEAQAAVARVLSAAPMWVFRVTTDGGPSPQALKQPGPGRDGRYVCSRREFVVSLYWVYEARDKRARGGNFFLDEKLCQPVATKPRAQAPVF